MGIDITGDVERFESGDTRQFTLTATVTVPASVNFSLFNTDGATLALLSVQAGETVQTSASGLFYFNRILPDSTGYYTFQWTAFDSSSRPYVTRGEFEIIKTQAESFFSYAPLANVLRDARHIIGRGDLTFSEIRPHMETAHDRINGKVALLYTTPVSPVFPQIQDMEKVFALWTLYADRYGTERGVIPPSIQARKDDYDELLDEWSAGSVALPVGSGIATLADPLMSSVQADFKPIFDSRRFEQQRIDPDLVDRDEDDDDRF